VGRRRAAKALCGWILGVAGASAALAQPAKPPLSGGGETISVRVVNLEVEVTDAAGKPVRGLHSSDFKLRIDGKDVPIDFFSEIRDAKTVADESESAASTQAPGTPVGRSILLVIDDYFAIKPRRDAALDAFVAGLPLLGPEDRVAVVALEHEGVELLLPWSHDWTAVATAINRLKLRYADGVQVLAQSRSLQGDVDLVQLIPQDTEIGQFAIDPGKVETGTLVTRVSPEARSRAHESADQAAGVLRAFPPVAGRRLLLLMSGGWALASGGEFYRPLQNVANQLGYTLLPIDVAVSDIDSLLAFDNLAAPTGGRAESGSTRNWFPNLLADASSYYFLGFTPSWPQGGAPHPTEVTMRRPDLRAQLRKSVADVSPHELISRRAEAALLFPQLTTADPTKPTMKAELGKPQVIGALVNLPVLITLPIAALQVSDLGGTYQADAPLAGVTIDSHGQRAKLHPSLLRFNLPSLPPAEGIARFRTTLQLRRIKQRLVLAVPDARTGEVMTVEIAFNP
jgi:VWFA-related protein